jgi:hypothetical protein
MKSIIPTAGLIWIENHLKSLVSNLTLKTGSWKTGILLTFLLFWSLHLKKNRFK